MLRPAGQPMPFCEAVSTASSFHSSKRISSEPTLQTPSTTTKVSGLTLCTSSLNAWISLSTPVDVSTCVTVIILYSFSFNAFSTSSSCGRSPMGAFSCVALTPYVSKQSANESAKYPVWRTSTSSPGSTRFAATWSQPSVPEPEMTMGCEAGSVVWKSLRRFWRTSLKQFTKGWPTCDSLAYC
jgi:hypothetical protein